MEFYDLNCVRPFGFPDDFAVAAEGKQLEDIEFAANEIIRTEKSQTNTHDTNGQKLVAHLVLTFHSIVCATSFYLRKIIVRPDRWFLRAVLVTVTVTAINSHSPQIDLSQPLWDVISSDSINSTPKVRIAIDLNGLKTRIKRGLIYFCPLGPMALPLRQSTKGLPNK
ncbi:hypothetical protein J6590_082930 [Homalodisca vitripennis]|nr:hypothetical protein J6590_082930 [Homalodisca vitripennis]